MDMHKPNNTPTNAETVDVENAPRNTHLDAEVLAIIAGKSLNELPQDLYIPPSALRVLLDMFEGPLDFLLYLIKRQNIDILDLPIAQISTQYMQYIDAMRHLQLDLAAEYLVMAAILAEIKSKMLLPRPVEVQEGEEDPRAELVRRLLEYQRFKRASEEIDQLPRQGRDFQVVRCNTENINVPKIYPSLSLEEVLLAFQEMLQGIDLRRSHRVQREPLSIRERTANILRLLSEYDVIDFEQCFSFEEGRSGLVVSLLSILEMFRSQIIEVVQAEAYSPIQLRLMNAA